MQSSFLFLPKKEIVIKFDVSVNFEIFIFNLLKKKKKKLSGKFSLLLNHHWIIHDIQKGIKLEGKFRDTIIEGAGGLSGGWNTLREYMCVCVTPHLSYFCQQN